MRDIVGDISSCIEIVASDASFIGYYNFPNHHECAAPDHDYRQMLQSLTF